MAKKAWLKGGKVVMKNGKVVLCEDCPCEEGNWCSRCYDTEQVEWAIVLSGFDDCDGRDLDGTHVVSRVEHNTDESYCLWRKGTISATGTVPRIDLEFNYNTNTVNLLIFEYRDAFNNQGTVQYQSSGFNLATLPCDEPFTLNRHITDFSSCPSLWPSTLQVDPYP